MSKKKKEDKLSIKDIFDLPRDFNYTGQIKDKSNVTAYFLNGVFHNESGPAIVFPDGDKEWYLNGIRHRIGAPAIERSKGLKEAWILN